MKLLGLIEMDLIAMEEEIINKNPAMAVKLQKAKDKKTIEIFINV